MGGINLIKFCVTAILIFVNLCFFCTVKVITAEKFEQEGFEYMGSMSPDNNDTKSGNERHRGISLFLSPPNVKETQLGAHRKCREWDGNLLFILNHQQFQDVQLATHGIGEPFWTSAAFDEYSQCFVWFGNNLIVDSSFIRSAYGCSRPGFNMGLTVQGSLSSYGLCSATTNSRFRFICRV